MSASPRAIRSAKPAGNAGAELGLRLRHARQTKGMTLKDVALAA